MTKYAICWFGNNQERFGGKETTLEDAEFICAYMRRSFPHLEHAIATIGDDYEN